MAKRFKRAEIKQRLDNATLERIGYETLQCYQFHQRSSLLEGPLDEICSRFQLLLKRLKEHGFHKATLDFGYDYDNDLEPEIHIFRMETDEEFKKRKARLKKQAVASKKAARKRAEKQKVKDKKKFEELKKTYGWK